MARYETKVDPNGSGPLDQVEAYVDDSGAVYFPGDEGYVEPGEAQATESEQSNDASAQDDGAEGGSVDPSAGRSDESPLDVASRVDDSGQNAEQNQKR